VILQCSENIVKTIVKASFYSQVSHCNTVYSCFPLITVRLIVECKTNKKIWYLT
jgi:hypothetical protein